MFPVDAIARAREIKNALNGKGLGAYSHSKGVKPFRQDVATFIEKRDGLESGAVDPEDIFLTTGASDAISMVLTAMIKDSDCGIMIPIPQYPIYSALLSLYNGQKVDYFLDEKQEWGLNIEEMERSLAEAKARGVNVSAFVLINPGNPTGQVLSPQQVREVLQFCSRNNLVVLADEVYQENVYREGDEFYSCRKGAQDLGMVDDNSIELFSFHSVSKGVTGECGQRGGYLEMVGIDGDVKGELYKLASSKLCSNVSGQAMVSLMCRGPNAGDVSYEKHEAEKKVLFTGLQTRANIVSSGLDSIPGFSCQPAAGAMYVFPKVTMPPGAIKEAARQGMSADTLYSIDLLKAAGICVVPASGFGQEEGRFGFRTTFLPAEVDSMIGSIKAHYEKFCAKYAE
jgi:aspartate/methionine/tyrosine aminotransferase